MGVWNLFFNDFITILEPYFYRFVGRGRLSSCVIFVFVSRSLCAQNFESKFGCSGLLKYGCRIEGIVKNSFSEKSFIDGCGSVSGVFRGPWSSFSNFCCTGERLEN